MPKRVTSIYLSEQEQAALAQLTKRDRSEQQVVSRARIILAAGQGASNAQIARELGINVDTVRLWRDRWASQQEADHEQMDQGAVILVQRLQDALAPEQFPIYGGTTGSDDCSGLRGSSNHGASHQPMDGERDF